MNEVKIQMLPLGEPAPESSPLTCLPNFGEKIPIVYPPPLSEAEREFQTAHNLSDWQMRVWQGLREPTRLEDPGPVDSLVFFSNLL